MPELSEILIDRGGPAGHALHATETARDAVPTQSPAPMDPGLLYVALRSIVADLLNAPHPDHWAARLGDKELAAMERLKTFAEANPVGVPLLDPKATMRAGFKCTRIQFMAFQEGKPERDCGGLCESSLVVVIRSILDQYAIEKEATDAK